MDLSQVSPLRQRTLRKKKTVDKSYVQFVHDIDNFADVKNIKNYVISAIKDDGYGLSVDPVGIL